MCYDNWIMDQQDMGDMAIPCFKELWYSPITREDHNEKLQSEQQGTYQKLKLVNTWTWGCASQVQQNSFNLTPNNMEIQTVQFAFYQKKCIIN